VTVHLVELKCGKSFKAPSMFVNPRFPKEGKILREIVARYPETEDRDGLNQIDGIVVSIKDWASISPYIFSGYVVEDKKRYKLKDRVLIIEPGLYMLFTGVESDKDSLLEVIGIRELAKTVNKISSVVSQKEKIDLGIEYLYPLLDAKVIQSLLKFQIRSGASILVSPSVPITSIRKFSEQLNKAREMNRISRILFDTVFTKYRDERDLMHLFAVNVSVLRPENIEPLKEAILANNPDHIGIRLMNFSENNTSRIWVLLKFIEELAKFGIPVHVFNVREFGYVTFCYGASSITTPIATDPYFMRSKSEDQPPRKGAYYHPIDMTNDVYDMLLEKTRSNNYRFPCHCEICEKFERVINVKEDIWNEFRRIHFLLVKNMELKELRETTAPLRIALKDKFARSQQTVWLPFLDKPIYS